MNGSNHSTKTIYQRAATQGAWLGGWFVVLFFLSVAGITVPIANIAVLTMALLVPFILFRWLRRTHYDAHGMESFSGLWMQGIITFGCASILLCLATYIYMRWISPDFILNVLRTSASIYRQADVEGAAELADEIQTVIDRHIYPNASTVAVMWLWLGTFTGSILSLIEAAIVRAMRVPDPKP